VLVYWRYIFKLNDSDRRIPLQHFNPDCIFQLSQIIELIGGTSLFWRNVVVPLFLFSLCFLFLLCQLLLYWWCVCFIWDILLH
jgi:hypothetical protein